MSRLHAYVARVDAAVPLPPSLAAAAAADPERTHTYACPCCPNTTDFIGVDDVGYLGEVDCSCGAGERDENEEHDCPCFTGVLRQPFTAGAPGQEPDYHLFVGGGYNAEIGGYTRITCAACGALLALSSDRPEVWEELILETPAGAPGFDRAAAVQRLLALAPSRVQALVRMRALTPADIRLTPELFALIAQHPDGRERQALLLMAPLLERTPDPGDAAPAPTAPASTSARPASRRGRRPR